MLRSTRLYKNQNSCLFLYFSTPTSALSHREWSAGLLGGLRPWLRTKRGQLTIGPSNLAEPCVLLTSRAPVKLLLSLGDLPPAEFYYLKTSSFHSGCSAALRQSPSPHSLAMIAPLVVLALAYSLAGVSAAPAPAKDVLMARSGVAVVSSGTVTDLTPYAQVSTPKFPAFSQCKLIRDLLVLASGLLRIEQDYELELWR